MHLPRSSKARRTHGRTRHSGFRGSLYLSELRKPLGLLRSLFSLTLTAGVELRPIAPDDPRPALRDAPGSTAVVATRHWVGEEVVGPYTAWVTVAPEFDSAVALLDRKEFEQFAVTTSAGGPEGSARPSGRPSARPSGPDATESAAEPLVFCAFPPVCSGPLAQLNDWRSDPERQPAPPPHGRDDINDAGPSKRRRTGGDESADGAFLGAASASEAAEAGDGSGVNCELVSWRS